ncbi:uncharacterized protein [Zea mays]|uniref:uncharacterized protein n=1 Tax=Zea mays TaxID=4577 RepID=UPI0002208B54|nr:uncharacterized protein LOC103645869 [Zea mays]|eukprot:XP_008668797.1 uncharacterized protein LOC103645869 [Zea mays]
MAPAKTDDPLSQLLAKIEEGNKETHRRMEAIQGAVGNMEAAVKVVMTEHGDLQKWKPEVEAKVTEISDALKAIQIQMGKMEKKPLGFGSRQEEEGEDGFLKPPPSDSSNLEFRREEGRTQFSHGDIFTGLQVPEEVLESRLLRKGGKVISQLLIKWSNWPVSLSTWEDEEAIKQKFPQAPAWGQAVVKEGGNVSRADHMDHAEERTQAVQQKAQTEGVKEDNQSPRSRRVPKPNTKYIGAEWRV